MKKKIIIFTSGGGQGHISATKALQSYLGDEFDIKPVYIFNEVFKSIEPCSLLSFGKITGEDVYNYFLRRRWYKLLNFMYDLGNFYFKLQIKTMKRIAKEYLARQKPDLVISVIPIVNGIILEAAQTNNIPFLLIPTDLDVRTFVRGIKSPSHKKFNLTLGFDDPLIRAKADFAKIPENQIMVTGLPVRRDFFEEKDKEAIKKQYNIPEGKPVIVLMMGGQGNSSIQIFTQQLATLTIPVHVIICIGRDTYIKESLSSIPFNPQVSTTIIGFTDRISDLLAIADLLITKSGSVSFCEGIYMNVPMILDATATLLYWERLNHVLLQKHDWGICLKKASHLNKAVTKILGNPSYHQAIKESLKKYPKTRLDLEIKPIVGELLA